MTPTPIRRILWVLAILLVLCLLMVGLAQAQPAASPLPPKPVTDDRGRVLRLDKAPQRIVSLLPSVTESVCALQQCHRLVGVDRYSNWPEAVMAALPKVGGGIDPSIEAIAALKPDLVLLSVASRASERMEALGLKVLALEPRSHADVRRVLRVLGDVLGVPPEQGAERVWREIDTAVEAASQSLPPGVQGKRVYFEVSRGPYAAGETSFIGETLTRLGVRNVVPAALGPFPRLNPEFVVRANPDVILVADRGMQPRTMYPGWAGMAAVRAQRICIFGPGDSDVIVRPGPRMAEAARLIATCLGEKAR